ncbi:MAG: hypothetical protein IT578_09700 [Verrucomicrobiae bacterium]|nr:hypothetical protein [Verrucomicrobiae bacterium]
MSVPSLTLSPATIRGRVVYLYAFDIAYDLSPVPSPTLLGQPLETFRLDASKRRPRDLLFFRPQMVRLPAVERCGPRGRARLERAIKLLPVGIMSVAVSVDFEVERIEDLVAFHEPLFDGEPLGERAFALAEEAFEELRSFCVRPYERPVSEEAYTVFCIHGPIPHAMDWLRAHRRTVAALLTEEPEAARLSEQEAEESASRALSYYDDDLAVVDWDAALLVNAPQGFEEILHVLELANVQLAGLESYDRLLDGTMDRAYADLRGRDIRRRRRVLTDLREIRIDLARLNDEMSNLTKFFGDWHLARIYSQAAERFHLDDWRRIVSEKLRMLDQIYEITQHDQFNRWTLVLEAAIVALFILDVVILLLGQK